MISVNVKVEGFDIRRLGKLPLYIEKNSMDVLQEIAEFTQRSAKARAPHFTGALSSSLMVKKQNSTTIAVYTDIPYAWTMESGEGLPMQVPIEGNPRLQTWLIATNWGREKKRDAGYRQKARVPKMPGHVVVTHYKPFIQPALDSAMNRLDTLIQRAIDKSITQMGG